MNKSTEEASRSDKYTAVIFVHGMGRQSQYQNLGRLLEALEEHCSEPEFGWLRQFRARTEPSRTGHPDDVPFVQFDRFEPRRHVQSPQGRWRFKGRFRAYEAYWSPVTARGANPWRVAVWALHQLAKPQVSRVASWRQFTHLRIARLHRLRDLSWTSREKARTRREDYLFAGLLAHIQRFRGHEGGRHGGLNAEGDAGRSEFADFATAKFGTAVSAPEVDHAVSAWESTRLPVENLASTTAWCLQLIGLAFLVFCGGSLLDIWRHGVGLGSATGLATVAVGIAAASLVGGRFLAETFSDVYIWNSNQPHDPEHARRNLVLARTRDLIEHVTLDPLCKRIVIVAHSLGTPITLETLALIGRRNEARFGEKSIIQLSKLSHFITLGSPIDKIFYFFQTRQAQTYRAGRLHDDLRGTLSQEPFFRNGAPRVNWLNIWDPADIVSDPLYSPLGNRIDGADVLSASIQNAQVENGSSFSAWKNHISYLDNDQVVASIADALFKNTTTLPTQPLSRRDPKVRTARAFTLRWTPPALLLGASVADAGFGLLGIGISAAPAAVLAICMAVSGTPEQRFNRERRRDKVKARLLVAVPSGD